MARAFWKFGYFQFFLSKGDVVARFQRLWGLEEFENIEELIMSPEDPEREDAALWDLRNLSGYLGDPGNKFP